MVDFRKVMEREKALAGDGRKVLICGDRFWTNYARILACVQKAHKTSPIAIIIEGDCKGADKMAGQAAAACGIPFIAYPAQWDKYRKAAGPIRNQQMLDEGRPTEVWAFHNDIMHSTGTADMVARACKAYLKVWVITDTTWRRLHIEDDATRLPF